MSGRVQLKVVSMSKYSLFRRIVQLVFTGALEALLDTSIMPQGCNGITDLRKKAITFDLSRLHEDGLHMVFIAAIFKRQLQRLHSLQDDPHRLNGVAVDDFLEGLAFVARVTTLVDELHLFEDGGLARLSSSCIWSQFRMQKGIQVQQRQSIPRSSILISFLCIILSRLSWFSISSFRAFPSLSSVLIPQPILPVFRESGGRFNR